jgi:uncharacterized protein with HEPN domain
MQRRFPTIPWQRIVGMRNILAHNYDAADPRIIYDTATSSRNWSPRCRP